MADQRQIVNIFKFVKYHRKPGKEIVSLKKITYLKKSGTIKSEEGLGI